MSKIIAIWLIAISLLIIACYSVMGYNLERSYFSPPMCEEDEDTVIYRSA